MVSGICAYRHRAHQLTKPGLGSLEQWGNGGNGEIFFGGGWRKTEENGGNAEKWGEMVGNWVNIGHSARDEGGGGLSRDVVEENERRMGEKWDEILIFHSPISPIFPEVEDLPQSSLCKNSSPQSPTEKLGMFATHRHPLRRLMQMLVYPALSPVPLC